MTLSAVDLIGRLKRPVRSVSVCLDLGLLAEHDELTARLEALQKQSSYATMAASGEGREVAEQLRALEEQMKAAEVVFKFQGISTYKLAEVQARFPSDNPRQAWDVNAGAHALIAAAAVEPTFTEDEAHAFLEASNDAIATKLFNAAWLAAAGSSDVPFSARASELLSGGGSK